MSFWVYWLYDFYFYFFIFIFVLHSVNENGLEDYVSHERPRFSSAETEVYTSRMPERHKYVTGELLFYFFIFVILIEQFYLLPQVN